MADIGQAFVQIVPSAKGIKGAVEEILGKEIPPAGDKAGGSLASSLCGKLKKGLKAGAIAVGAALIAGIALSVKEGAALEQSLGGIETLFKNNAKIVIKNAEKAYRTAGLSANAYMEQATSFSASLLQSLGGDTKRAAQYADMAIIDMSDNANKFGTDIGRIQDAYQGFAKQNYSMLDNLKLGYGGTKTEMERLLADAGKITGKKYDISNLADVYEAIHVIQKEMDVTGTTSKEAAETLSGSFSSMKAAAQNLMGNLALGRDIQAPMKELAISTGTFLFNNLLPAIWHVVKQIPTLFISGFDALKAKAPTIMAGLGVLLGKALNFLIVNIPPMLDSLFNFLVDALGNLPAFLSGLLQGLFTGVDWSSIWQSVKAAFAQWWTDIKADFMSAWNGIKGAFVQWGANIKADLNNIKAGFAQWGANIKADFMLVWNGIKAYASTIWNGITGVISGAINIAKNTITSVVNIIKSIMSFDGLVNIVTKVFDSIKNAIKGRLEAAKNIVSSIINRIKEALNFKAKLGNIKIPHIHVSGGQAPFGIGGKGKLPSFSIDWYKKGGIFDSPSLIGVGEAGSEAVVPLDKFWGSLDSVNNGTREQTLMLIDELDAVINRLNVIIEQGNRDTAMTLNNREFGRLVRGV